MKAPQKSHRNRQDTPQSNKKIQALQNLLATNKRAQKQLTAALKGLKERIRELQDAGTEEPKTHNGDSSRKSHLFTQVNQMPQILVDQRYIKQTPFREIGFVRAVTQKKIPRSEEIGLKKLGSDAQRINFVEQSANFIRDGQIPLEAYKKWRKIFSKKNKRQVRPLTETQQQQLVKRKKIYGENWQKLGFCYNGFSFQDIYYLYHNKLCQRDLGKWTLRNNIIMIILVEYYGRGKWASVSKNLKTKSQFQCRQRFCNILDPEIVQNTWTEEEEALLLEVAEKYDYKWSTIVKEVKQFEKKTDNAVRRKFRNLIMKYPNEQIDKRVKKQKLAESIKKFKFSYYNRKKKVNKNRSSDDES